jgi:hypothetical protein
MKMEDIVVIGNMIDSLSALRDVEEEEIINNLIGLLWDEEEAGELKEFISQRNNK